MFLLVSITYKVLESRQVIMWFKNLKNTKGTKVNLSQLNLSQTGVEHLKLRNPIVQSNKKLQVIFNMILYSLESLTHWNIFLAI